VSVWGWPQIVVALLAIFGFVFVVVGIVRDRNITSERAAIKIFLFLSYYAFYAYTLHAGRFW
jgi:cytochrome c oxidase assembly factor CtaG